jgi:hypothetical protein
MTFHSIVINPELAASALRNDEADLFLIWLLSKKIDVNNNGIVELPEVINIINKTLGIQSNYIYKKLKVGENKYWRKPYGTRGSKKMCLLSTKNIIDRLNPDITRAKAFIIPSNIFKFESSKSCKNLLVGLVAARFEDCRPISIDSLIKNTGQSESTIRNAIKSCSFIKVKSNYELILECNRKLELNQIMQSFDTPWSYRVVQSDEKYQLLRQLPNSYVISEFDRQPLKYRPDKLKKLDKAIFANLVDKKYHIKNEKITLGESSIVTFNLA